VFHAVLPKHWQQAFKQSNPQRSPVTGLRVELLSSQQPFWRASRARISTIGLDGLSRDSVSISTRSGLRPVEDNGPLRESRFFDDTWGLTFDDVRKANCRTKVPWSSERADTTAGTGGLRLCRRHELLPSDRQRVPIRNEERCYRNLRKRLLPTSRHRNANPERQVRSTDSAADSQVELHKGSSAPIGPGTVPVETVKVIRPNHVSGLSRINVLQCRKRCTGQQKGSPFCPFRGTIRKSVSFSLCI